MWRIGLVLAAVLLAGSARGQVLKAIEAETCEHRGGTASHEDAIWCSGRGVVGDFWGERVGDSIRVVEMLRGPAEDVGFAVRYSFDEGHYKGFRGLAEAGDGIALRIDGGAPIPMAMPGTGGWHVFDSVMVPLPPLEAGRHTFVLESTAANSTRNIDTFYFVRGGLDAIPPSKRATIVARSANKRWELAMTPDVQPIMAPGQTFAELDRMWDLESAFLGWTPPTPVRVHLISERLWDNPGATAYQNQWGLFFRAELIAREQGNMAHEMTHQFYQAHFPGWFDESSVRALTSLVWMPRLYGTGKDEAEGWLRDGRSLLANPRERITTPERLWSTVCAKYGVDVFSRFFHACRDAGAAGEINFTPGRHLTKEEIVRLMSRAAGEDVGGIFARWDGFAGQP